MVLHRVLMTEQRARCQGEVTYRDPRRPGVILGRQCTFAAVATRRPYISLRPTPAEVARLLPIPVCRRHGSARQLYHTEQPERYLAL